MVARRPEQAVDALLDRIRTAASCVSSRPVIGAGSRTADIPISIGFAPIRQSASLDRSDERGAFHFWFSASHKVRQHTGASRGFVTEPIGYMYQVATPTGNEILAYHWHPDTISNVDSPHLHVSSRLAPIERGVGRTPLSLGDLHLPTGFIRFEDIVRLLIEEFGVEPLRSDWRKILVAHQDDSRDR